MGDSKLGAVILVRPHERAWPDLNTKITNALNDLGIEEGRAFEVRPCYFLKTAELAEQAYKATQDAVAVDREHDVTGDAHDDGE